MKMLSVLLIAFGIFASVPATSANAQTTPIAPPTFMVDDSQDGQTLTVTNGGIVQVSLEENLSTGYSWEVRAVDGNLVDHVWFNHVSGVTAMPGASGTCIVSFQVKGPGSGKVTLAYARPGGAPAKTFTVNLVVK